MKKLFMNLLRFNDKLLRYELLLVVYILSSILFLLPSVIEGDINNYRIFSSSFQLLIRHENLYTEHPEYYWDFYRYTPTFAVLMAPFALFPEYIGVFLWSSLNALALFWGVKSIFRDNERKGSLVLWIILIELITSLQNCQSNALVVGLMLLSFASFQRQESIRASFFTTLNFFIKIYGFASAALFFLYPKKLKFIGFSLMWMIILFLLPLVFISPEELKMQYISEFSSVSSYSTDLSIMSAIQTITRIQFEFLYVQIFALILLLCPLIFCKYGCDEKIKFLFNCSLMIFVVSFNQMAESPTYIIGVTGAALWFVESEKSKINILLFILLMSLTCLAPTDFYPKYIRNNFFVPYKIKAIPLFFIWLKVQFDIWKKVNEKYHYCPK